MLDAISIALTGLDASAKKAGAAASNIANMTTTGALSAENGPAPYTPQTVVQSTITDTNGNSLGVKSTFAAKDPAFVPAYSPNAPFADSAGLIGVPNVDMAEEAVNLKLAELSYKANLKTIETEKEMSEELFRIFDEKV